MQKDKKSFEPNDLKKMLSAVFTLCLLNQDMKESDIDLLVASARTEARKKYQSLKPNRAEAIDLVFLGSVLHRWNRNPKYLDQEARPLPIRSTGKAPSVEALFRAEKRLRYFKQGLQDMRRAGLVSHNGRGLYLPRNDSILLHTLTPEMVANLSLSVNRLVTTLLHNTAANRRSDERLIERNALVTDLPREKLNEFIVFARQQGAALVSTMNDWLENRRCDSKDTRPRSRKRKISAGIHVFAFCDDESI
jgi:hypothetical protein